MTKDELKTLTAAFRKLGVKAPASWARSQVREGIPQLARFLFLRGAWMNILTDEDTSWIQPRIDHALQNSDAPLAGVGFALQRLLASGADPEDLTAVVRGMQYDTLAGILWLLDDASMAHDDLGKAVPREARDMAWGLWEHDQNETPIRRIKGLLASALATDPTGREMRPRRSSSKPKARKRQRPRSRSQ